MPDGSVVKWCDLCGSWTDHYRAGYPDDSLKGDEGAGYVATKVIDDEDGGTDGHTPDAFARLRDAGFV